MAKTLFKKYQSEIRAWDWQGLKAEALENIQPDMWLDQMVASVYLGCVLFLAPSGKFYTPWACGNVSSREAYRDEQWYAALDSVAEEHGMTIESGEGDPCDLFATMCVEEEESE